MLNPIHVPIISTRWARPPRLPGRWDRTTEPVSGSGEPGMGHSTVLDVPYHRFGGTGLPIPYFTGTGSRSPATFRYR
jgi:hypothetical protein